MPNYFAYGSNLHPDQLRRRCPGAELVGAAKLRDHRLAFTRESVRTFPGSGVADLIPAADLTVWGALHRIDDGDFSALDRLEGAGKAYERLAVTVHLEDGRTLEGTAYRVIDEERRQIPPEVPPSATYLEQLIAGARACGLPARYIAFLRSLRPQEGVEFRHGLLVHPTRGRVEARERPVVTVSAEYAAEHGLRGQVAVVHRGRASLAELHVSDDCPDGAAQVDEALRHALGISGRECFGSHVSIEPVRR